MYEQPFNPFQRNVAIIKDYFKSPSVLILAILQIVSVIASFIQSFVTLDATREFSAKMLEYVKGNLRIFTSTQDYSQEIQKIQDTSGSISLTVSIPVFAILTIVALFLIYFKSRNAAPDSTPKAGFTILNVLAILAVIGMVLAVVVMVVSSVALFILYSELTKRPDIEFNIELVGVGGVHFDANLVLIIAIAFTVFTVIFAVVGLLYVISYKRYIGSIRTSMTTVELSRSGAKTFGVLCVISAVFSGLGLLSSFASLFSSSNELYTRLGIQISSDKILPMVFSVLTQAVALAILIFRAKLALGYAKYIDSKKYGYDEPVNPEGPAPYVPYGVGVGSSSQQNPYTYLTQQNEDSPTVDVSDVNPYMDDFNQTAPVCPKCGAPVDSTAPFCGQCGSRLM